MIGGTVSGLAPGSTLTLINNKVDALSVRGNGAFAFTAKVSSGYSVTIGAQPNGQTCTVSNGVGTAQGDVTSVSVTCIANNSSGGTGNEGGACVRYPNDVVVCSGQSTKPPDVPPSYQLCVYSEINYGGRQACGFWNGFDVNSYVYGDRIRSVRVRTISFDAQTGAIIAGDDVSANGIFDLKLWPMSSRSVVTLTSSSTDITRLLPRNGRVRLLEIKKASP